MFRSACSIARSLQSNAAVKLFKSKSYSGGKDHRTATSDAWRSHPWLQFTDAEAQRRLLAMSQRRILASKSINWDLLGELSVRARMLEILINAGPVWLRAFEINGDIYRELTYEFFSTYHLRCDGSSFQTPDAITFRLGGENRSLSIMQFGVCMGLYTQKEVDSQFGKGSQSHGAYGLGEEDWTCELQQQFWRGIASDDTVYTGTNQSTQIRKPMHRVLHKIIAHSLSDRHDGGVVTPRDLLYMYCILTPATCNVAHTLARYLTFSYGRKQDDYLCGGVFVTRLAQWYGILREQGTSTSPTPLTWETTTTLLDEADLIKMNLIHRVDDRLHWCIPQQPGEMLGPRVQKGQVSCGGGPYKEALETLASLASQVQALRESLEAIRKLHESGIYGSGAERILQATTPCLVSRRRLLSSQFDTPRLELTNASEN